MRKVFAASVLAAVPSSAYSQTVIVDDVDPAPRFVTTGDDWTSWGMSGDGHAPSDSSYLYESQYAGDGNRRGMAIWSPVLPSAGQYRISTWFRRTSNRTTDADFFVLDGDGGEDHYVVNQRGAGGSGWVDLGEHPCDAGFSGCRVTLDGTDDDQSDEANAVRFVWVSGGGAPAEPSPEPPPGCEAFPGLGTHEQRGFATVITANGWEDRSRATGAPDGRGAHTENADAGEFLRGRGFTICDPPGEERIDAVFLAVRARTQYESGVYDVSMALDGGGMASRTFHGTEYRWHGVELTDDRPSWSWADLGDLRATVELDSHPGGRRDSDVWVDALRLRVLYTTLGAPPPSARDEEGEGPEPEECEGGCADAADWWWGSDDANNGDGLAENDLDGEPPAADDAPAAPEERDRWAAGAPLSPREEDDGVSPLLLSAPSTAWDGCGGSGAAWIVLLAPGFLRRRSG
jgi:hypothetical protein